MGSVFDDKDAPFYKWFAGARCNIVYNALDRHIETANKNKLALIWEGEPGDSRKYTYFELYREVNRFANVLRSLGIRKGDRIVIYMPQLPETVIAMLAAAKIGAIHSVVFAGFPPRRSASASTTRRPSCSLPPTVFTATDRSSTSRTPPTKHSSEPAQTAWNPWSWCAAAISAWT